MSSKLPDKKSSSQDIQAFLTQVNKTPVVKKASQGRLIFAMDATASREHCWDMASQHHAAMFTEAEKLSDLTIQLCYYRGFGEFKAEPWTTEAPVLRNKLLSVRCLAGQTQIKKILQHALKETQSQKVNAIVFVGDCVEEDPDMLGTLAGKLGILKVPLFIFQEGHNDAASRLFPQLAKLSGGAHCRFNEGSAKQLGNLLKAVAVYAAGGKNALKENLLSQDATVRHLLTQL